MENTLEECISNLSGVFAFSPATSKQEPAILRVHNHREPSITTVADGDKYLLVEYGENEAQFSAALPGSLLEQRLREEKLPALSTSLQECVLSHSLDNRVLPRESLLDALDAFDATMPDLSNITVRLASCHMPLSLGWIRRRGWLSKKYMQAVRPDVRGVRAISSSSVA